MAITITNHGVKRLRQRLGIPKKSCYRTAQKAFDCGIKSSDVKGEAYNFLRRTALKNISTNNVIVYGKFLYVFSNETLITVLHAPKDIEFNASNVNR